MRKLGRREFQLHLLALMPETDVVTNALMALDANREVSLHCLELAEEAGLFKVPHFVEKELSILGPPSREFATTVEREFLSSGFEGSKTLAFDLETFQGYQYLVNVTRHGYAWGQRFGRVENSPTPRIASHDDLKAWRLLKPEVLAVLRSAEWIDGFSFQEVFSGEMRSGKDGSIVKVICRFDFELLQKVTIA